jgi:SAM-dependent methyltransferase
VVVTHAKSDYALLEGDAAVARLHSIARVHRAATETFLDRIGIGSSARWLDVGCGAGDVARLLAERGARVVGIDADDRALAAARADLARFGDAIELRHGHAQELADEAAFDGAYARCLLSHLRTRDAVLDAMVRATRPGGLVAIEDVDFSGAFCEPASAAFDRYVALYGAVVHHRGGDPNLGRALPSMLLRRGLVDVRVDAAQAAFVDGEGKSLARLTLEHLRASILGEALAAPAEIDELTAELGRFEQARDTLVAMPRIVQAWGRRPG